MTKTLEQLTIRNGKFYDEDGRRILVEYIGHIDIGGLKREVSSFLQPPGGRRTVVLYTSDSATIKDIESHAPERADGYLVEYIKSHEKRPGTTIIDGREVFDDEVSVSVAHVDYYRIRAFGQESDRLPKSSGFSFFRLPEIDIGWSND